ncbi:hypothetical protein BpHYR1_048931 [Brachionus plicatilis]|uniref:Uncharacterized protein n=1 Tax=Brachionus plicatilis TaxID=10195 RepID=A0A3M7QSU0_BRAPC|nr:hypothetical protein BpHYR1_048931 [Brachionus plicatilis]
MATIKSDCIENDFIGNSTEEKISSHRLEDTRKKIFDKSVTRVDDDDKTLTQSNVVSIDIEPASTFLPLMCKLIIICDGAVVERGQCLMVRDVNTQVSEDEFKVNTNTKVKIRCFSARERQDQFNQTNSKFGEKSLNVNFSNDSNRRFSPLDSLQNLSQNYFESFEDLNDYWSIPYYQYQKKLFHKQDFSINTTESDILKSYSQEVVPEYSRQRIPSFRNEMFMIVNNKQSPIIVQSNFANNSFISESYHVKRSYIEERFSKFEAEVVISDRKQKETPIPIKNCTSTKNDLRNEVLVSHQKSLPKNDSRLKTRSERSSVTNLIMMHLKNGRIIE